MVNVNAIGNNDTSDQLLIDNVATQKSQRHLLYLSKIDKYVDYCIDQGVIHKIEKDEYVKTLLTPLNRSFHIPRSSIYHNLLIKQLENYCNEK